ncbi:hypothetical protein [Rhodococcus sp. ACT016]|uniref:hypothetical protein n=1 Tax=Rhodococcus sp. ACT016 TaxID=3134808 RepID=UPI003D29B982
MQLRAKSAVAVLVACGALILASCASESDSATSGDVPSTTEASELSQQPQESETPKPAPSLVDPVEFSFNPRGQLTGYFFTTPTGLWRCAILIDSAQQGPDSQMAGCQPKTSTDLNVAGAPLVPDHAPGNPVPPNAILVNRTDEARFARLSQALFWRTDGVTPVLGYGQTLSTDEFSCNVQEAGVSCRSDGSDHGFTFSTDRYQYIYVEALSAPSATPVQAAATPDGPEPVLGRVWAPNQNGYGEVRPDRIYNGGSPSGLIYDVVWQDWGGEQATGTGQSPNVKIARTVADAPFEPATVVAYDLGECEGTWMYRSLVWFFPSNGDTFESAKQYSTNLCQ